MTVENKETATQFLKVVFDVLPAARDAFIGLLGSVRAELPNVPGCGGVAIFAHGDDPNRFILIEEWDSREAHQAHVDGLVESGAWSDIEAMLSRPPESHYMVRFRQNG